MEQLARQKTFISQTLRTALEAMEHDSIQKSAWQKDGSTRIHDYATRGKMIRGALVDLGFRLYCPDPERHAATLADIHRTGAAMELFQSMLLMHDDVMDQDELRRGKPAIHVQYRSLAQEQGCRQPGHLGESMAICLGDVCAFQAFELLSAGALEPACTVALVRLFSRELSYVGYAQMEDVYNSCAPDAPPSQSIIQVYRFKTGRYTFSLPLMAGSLIAGAGEAARQDLARLGELLGIMFQIRDDHIGLFGNPDQTGKPRGADIREDKKTLHRAYLTEAMDISDQELFSRTFGCPHCIDSDLDQILDLFERRGVTGRIEAEMELYAREARQIIAALGHRNPEAHAELEALLVYNQERRA